MTTALLAPLAPSFQTAPAALRTIPAVRTSPTRVGDGGPTLDRAISQAWEGLVAGRAVGPLSMGTDGRAGTAEGSCCRAGVLVGADAHALHPLAKILGSRYQDLVARVAPKTMPRKRNATPNQG